jgi:hypothetical protein
MLDIPAHAAGLGLVQAGERHQGLQTDPIGENMHALAHYASIIAFVFAGICGLGLLVMLKVALDMWGEKHKLVWEVPAVTLALGLGWLLLAAGLAELARV